MEHHRYDHKEEDDEILSESFAFILFFVDGVLKGKLERDVLPETLREIQRFEVGSLEPKYLIRLLLQRKREIRWLLLSKAHWPIFLFFPVQIFHSIRFFRYTKILGDKQTKKVFRAIHDQFDFCIYQNHLTELEK